MSLTSPMGICTHLSWGEEEREFPGLRSEGCTVCLDGGDFRNIGSRVLDGKGGLDRPLGRLAKVEFSRSIGSEDVDCCPGSEG